MPRGKRVTKVGVAMGEEVIVPQPATGELRGLVKEVFLLNCKSGVIPSSGAVSHIVATCRELMRELDGG